MTLQVCTQYFKPADFMCCSLGVVLADYAYSLGVVLASQTTFAQKKWRQQMSCFKRACGSMACCRCVGIKDLSQHGSCCAWALCM